MRRYLSTLSSQPLPARRRFVVVATTLSFLLIVLVWIGLNSLGSTKESGAENVPVPSRAAERASPLEDASALNRLSPGPDASPAVDVGQISADLLRAFGASPSPLTSP